METKNREKLLLIATGAVAVLWLFNWLVISPLTESWHSRSDEIARLKKQIAAGTTLLRRDSIIRGRWDSMRGNALAGNPTAAERQMFTAFDRWVRSSSVTEGSFRPQVQEGETAAYSTVDCRSDVSGNLASVKDFLRAMSKDPLANKVDSLEVTSKDDNGQQLTLGLSLSGLILAESGASPLPPQTNAMALARETGPAADPRTDPYQIILRNNIFNQSRTPRDNPDGRPRPRVETLACGGVCFDNGVGVASFEGSGVDTSRFYRAGESVNRDFKVAKINLNYTVTLTNSESNTFVLPDDKSVTLRRENSGDWRRAGYIAADTTPDTGSTASDSLTPASGAGGNSMLEILKKRREEAEK